VANNAKVNYDDKRFAEVKEQEQRAVNETTSAYNNMINDSESYYQQQIDASKEWADKQSEIQQAQTDFTIEKVDQAKEQAEKDYTKEQRGAYTDYQKATNQYGANAETLASQGLNQAGYSESTRTNLFNTYQNRYASARESYNKAILNYDNSIKEAQLANSAALATIAYEALQKQLELSLQGFQYKNQLVLQKLDAINAEKDRYYNRYQNVLSQINTENAMAEQIRQYNASQAESKRQYNESLAFQKSQAKQQQKNWEKEYALSKKKASSSGGSGGGIDLSGADLPQNDPKNPKKQTELSKAAQSLYDKYSKLLKNTSKLGNVSKSIGNVAKAMSTSAVKAAINKAYNNGKGTITATDVELLAGKLGL
jgi:hypothetical protein